MPLVIYANFGMRSRLFVGSDIAETMRRISQQETFFRLSVGFDLLYCIGVVVILASLYIVLAAVNKHLALIATLLKLIYVVSAVLTGLSFLSVVRLTDASYVQALQPQSLQAWVRFNWYGTQQQYYVGLLFWSLSSVVLGWLWLKSRYVPAALAAYGLAWAAWCAVCTFAYLLMPAFQPYRQSVVLRYAHASVRHRAQLLASLPWTSSGTVAPAIA